MTPSDDIMRPIIGVENRTAQEVFDIMCDRFRAARTPDAGVLREALAQWRCPSCGGSGQYYQRGNSPDTGEFVEGFVKCKVCGGNGLHPTASAALASPEPITKTAIAERGEPDAARTTNPPLTIGYTNHRGEHSTRTLHPRAIWFGSTEWHPEPQWLLKAWDVEKDAERDFAIRDFGEPDAEVANMVLVPREPTIAMSWAGEAEYMRKGLGVWSDFHAIYRAMIAAAPSQEQPNGK